MKLSEFLKENDVYEEFINKFDKEFHGEWEKYVDCAINSAFKWKIYSYWNILHIKWIEIENKENDMLWLLDEDREVEKIDLMKSIEKSFEKDNDFKVKEKDYIEIENYKFVKPEFECELLKATNESIFGVIKEKGSYHMIEWSLDGTINDCSHALYSANSFTELNSYNLTHYPLQWHENENNFPCLCVVNEDVKVIKNKQTFDVFNSDNDFTIRLANKEDFERYYYDK